MLVTLLHAPPAEAVERQPGTTGSRAEIVANFNPADSSLIERTETTDVYANGKAKTAVISAGKVNFRDDGGAWRKIDNNLRVEGDRIVNVAGAVDVSLARNGSARDLAILGDEKSKFSFGLQGADDTAAVIDRNTVTYKNMKPDVDVRYTLTGEGLTEHIILDKASAAVPEFRFDVGNLDTTMTPNDKGITEVRSAKGDVLFSLPPGKAWDDGGKSNTDVAVKHDAASKTLAVGVDPAWLNDESRNFPVTIDPDVTFGPSAGASDTYISSANQNTNYNSAGTTKIGKCATGDEMYGYVKWDLSSIAGQTISNASLTIQPWVVPSATIRAAQPIRLWHVNEPWSASDFTWAKTAGSPPQGNHDTTGKDLYGTDYNVDTSYDFSAWVRNWVSGAWPNYGVSMDAAGYPGACWELPSVDVSTSGPRLAVTFGDPDTGRRDFMSYFDQQIDASTSLSVNLASGNLNVTSADFEVPGVTEGLSINRQWSSKRPYQQEFDNNGWQIQETMSGIYPSTTGAIVYLPGNSPAYFGKLGGGYSTPAGMNAQLTEAGTGTAKVSTLELFRTGKKFKYNTLADGRGYLTQLIDRNNNTVTYNYDTANTFGVDSWPRLTSITDTFGQTTTVTWTSGFISRITDHSGRYVDYIKSGNNLIRAENVARGWQSYGYYGTDGMLNFIQTPSHRSLELAYDTSRRVTSITWFDSSYSSSPTWTFSYTALSNGESTTTVTDPNGKATVYTADSSLRIKKTKDPLNHEHSQTWTANNDPSQFTSATGGVSTNSYNGLNNLTSTRAPKVNASDTTETGRQAQFGYPTTGNQYLPNSATDTQSNSTSFLYNTAGNRTQSTNPQASSNNAILTYNTNGQVTSATDGKGTTTYYTYTGKRLTGIDHPSPLGDESFTYDTLGRMAPATDGKGQTATFTYNNNGSVTQVSYTGGAVVSFGYDEDEMLTSRTDATGSWSFTNDGLRRPKTKNIPGGTSNSATYDKAGNVLTYTDPNGTVNYTYDDANNLTKLAEPGGSCTGTVSLCTTFSYDNANRRTSTAYPNGVTQNITYDNSGRIKTVKATKGATVLTDYTYTYQNTSGVDKGLTQKVVDNRTGERTEFGYDNMNRLTNATTYSSTNAYIDDFVMTWDANSNRKSYWRNGSSTSNYTYNSVDQMTNSPSFTFSYDANGDMTSSTWGFSGTYNTKGQATAIKGQGGSTTLNMTYAGIGQSERTAAGSTSLRERLIGGLADETTSGVTTSYVMDPKGNLISQKKSGVRQYFLFDKLGSVVALTDSSGNVAQRFQYDPFGKVLTTTITTDSNFKFAGGYYDSATKLYKFGERYYDPNFNTWTQRDTLAGNIEDAKTLNRYVYVGGDPVNYIDLAGLFSLKGCLYYSAQAVGSAVGYSQALTAGVGLAVAPDPTLATKALAVGSFALAGLAVGSFVEASQGIGKSCT